MGAAILAGAAIAAAGRAELAEEVASLSQVGVTPGLGTILVGDNQASASYVRLKHQDCEEIGIRSFGEHLPADATEDQLHEVISSFNANPDIDAFLVQLPLPKGLDELRALLAVDPAKDVTASPPSTWAAPAWANPGPFRAPPPGSARLPSATACAT